ncbi:MAG: PQQ-binding-like beta-propeller repeat protein [Pirellula sp.]|jgi:outer membrane protein assembly factor BamB
MRRAPICFWLILLMIGGAVESAGRLQATDWTTSRGDAASTGFAAGSLPKEPELLWEFSREKSGYEGSPVIAAGKVFAGDVEGNVYCLDLATGNEVWKTNFKNGFVASPAYRNGRVVLGDFDGRVVCLNADDGKVLWEADIRQAMAAGANFVDDLVLITSEGGELFAFRLESGELAWEYSTGDQLRSSPTIWKHYALLGGCDGRLHKIDLKLGKAEGDGLMLEGPSGSTPAIFGDMAVVPTQSGQVLAFDMLKGEKLWSFSDAERAQEIRSSPAIVPLSGVPSQSDTGSDGANSKAGNTIAVVTTRNRRVLGLGTIDGKMVWEAVVRKRCDASPVICDGRVWVGGLDGNVYAFDAQTGEQRWTYQLTGQLIASPSISDGKLLVATDKGTIACFGAK